MGQYDCRSRSDTPGRIENVFNRPSWVREALQARYIITLVSLWGAHTELYKFTTHSLDPRRTANCFSHPPWRGASEAGGNRWQAGPGERHDSSTSRLWQAERGEAPSIGLSFGRGFPWLAGQLRGSMREVWGPGRGRLGRKGFPL
jgi:hypothetical protein